MTIDGVLVWRLGWRGQGGEGDQGGHGGQGPGGQGQEGGHCLHGLVMETTRSCGKDLNDKIVQVRCKKKILLF